MHLELGPNGEYPLFTKILDNVAYPLSSLRILAGSWRGKGKIPVWTYTTKIMSSSSIQLHLQNDTEKQTNGLLEGFYINYHAVRRGGEPVPDLLSEPNHTMTVCASATTVILTGLTIYTTYKIEVALITSKGTGKFSEPLYAGICKNIFLIC